MRSVIAWIIVLMAWILVAVTAPDWFPWWLQGGFWGFALGSAFFGGAYTLHMVFMRDRIAGKDEDIKRLETKNTELKAEVTELKNQLQSHSALQPQPLKPVSVIEVSDSQTKPLLLEPEKSKAQSSLKIRAYKLAKQIEKVIEKAQSKTPINNNDLLYNAKTGGVQTVISSGFVPYEQSPPMQAFRITRDALDEYKTEIHNTVLEIREKLLAVSKNNPLSLESYSCPQALSDLEKISNNLRSLADGIPD